VIVLRSLSAQQRLTVDLFETQSENPAAQNLTIIASERGAARHEDSHGAS
jgi:hypothetical protein